MSHFIRCSYYSSLGQKCVTKWQRNIKLYPQEYWIVDRIAQRMEIYRRENAQLKLVTTLLVDDAITSLLLPNFTCEVKCLFVSRS